MSAELIAAIERNDRAEVGRLLAEGANPSDRAPDGLTALMLAAGRGQLPIVQTLLDYGADLFAVEPRAGASVLHKACQGGNVEVVQLLLDGGALVDWPISTTGHTPLIEAIWYKWPEIVDLLLQSGATLNLSTHYGFTLKQHLDYALTVNPIGQDRLKHAEELVRRRDSTDQQQAKTQRLMLAVVSKNVDNVRAALAAGDPVDERSPRVNGFNDYHTPLLVACRDGPIEIVRLLLEAHADVNAVEPTFGAVPLHKATYNGHADITRLLVQQPAINLDYRGATNGYTPLHDALWHGFADCAEILIAAGAQLNLRGHDGKTPLDIAEQTFGPQHELVGRLRSKVRGAAP
jgi:uncharacterized protein